MSPLFIGDLLEVIVNASLDPQSPEGTFECGGPETMTADAFARLLNPADTQLRHLPVPIARLLSRVVPGLNPTMVDVLLTDAEVGPASLTTAAHFGVELHKVSEVWSPSRKTS
jgi:hypothetical protein